MGLRKHGLSSHPWYAAHRSMMYRCYNPNDKGYKLYGAIGIRVYEPWHDVATFIRDIESLLGERPKGYSIDRRNPWGDYEPRNVRWADGKTQANNRRDPEAHRVNVSKALKGKKRLPFTLETREKIRFAKMGNKNWSKQRDIKGRFIGKGRSLPACA
jgi:NUMOD3 motif